MDRTDICDKFIDSLSRELYPFQEDALLAWFESDNGLLVTAPTGMGKTLLAEAAVFEALHTGRELYYTTPLIALTDQKFRDFQKLAAEWGFAADDIGLVTGNRRVNPTARVRIVVAEILLNHLLGEPGQMSDVAAVVMDEFHYFNDYDRGIVWELSLSLMPAHVRLMLLSATVGNAAEFVAWVREKQDRTLRLISSHERKVPLEYEWIGDKLLTEHLPEMLAADDVDSRVPALVFCFNRDECWEVAEKLKGVSLITPAQRARIEEIAAPDAFSEGIGPKLRHMLIRGVGVHHAGILPKFKEIVEDLFLQKLVPFVICTETLAAGINLPARSVVLSSLMKGKPGERKIVAPSSAHQMFGRAGRPQFDTKGYVYALAHEDDVKIEKWRRKYAQIDPNSKDPGIIRARKDLERKRPSRRKTQEYWSEGQFTTLIKSGPAKLASHSMIPYGVLIHLLTRGGSLGFVRRFLEKRFNTPPRLQKFQEQLDRMIANLEAFQFLKKAEDADHVTLHGHITELLTFRSVDPIYGVFLARQLARATFVEKMLALESLLPVPRAIERQVRPPDIEPGPFQTGELEPLLLQMGIALPHPDGGLRLPQQESAPDYLADDRDLAPPITFPEMLKALFDSKLATPELIFVQPKWVCGGIVELECEFYKFVRARDLAKNEGVILRHLLRLVILAGEFLELSGSDPDYQRIGELATRACQRVDPRYTDRFLAEAQAETRTAPAPHP